MKNKLIDYFDNNSINITGNKSKYLATLTAKYYKKPDILKFTKDTTL